MKILISGSSGMVGSALAEELGREGHTVFRLVRPQSTSRGRAGTADTVRWDPPEGEFDADAAEAAEAVVHLAGASIGEGRWSAARKQMLRSSRVHATRHLVTALANLRRPPRIFLSASAMGYYGDRGEETLTEDSAPGNDFLARLARDWEAEAARVEQFGARVAMFRFGIILARDMGALPRILLPIRLGVGGRLGTGRQWMSWITLADVVALLTRALADDRLRGPVNAVTPNPVRNAEFVRTAGRVLHRPTLFPAPALALRLLLGEMADALLLASQRVVPRKLQALSYNFEQPELEPALRAVLHK